MSTPTSHYTCTLLADHFAATGLPLYAVEPLDSERAILSYPSPAPRHGTPGLTPNQHTHMDTTPETH